MLLKLIKIAFIFTSIIVGSILVLQLLGITVGSDHMGSQIKHTLSSLDNDSDLIIEKSTIKGLLKTGVLGFTLLEESMWLMLLAALLLFANAVFIFVLYILKSKETPNKIKNENTSKAGKDAQNDARPF